MSEEKPKESFEKVAERLTQENSSKPRQEYPKMLFRTDGTNLIVEDKKSEEEALRSGDVHPNPAAAIAEKEKRDKAEKAKAAPSK